MAADPARLEQYANRLQEKAGSRVTFTTVVGLLVGAALGGAAALLPHFLHVHSAIKQQFAYAVPLIGAVGGAYLGYLIGQSRAVSLRLQAGLAVHQLEMERMLHRIEAVRPHLPLSAPVVLPPAQAPASLPAPAMASLPPAPAPAPPAPPLPSVTPPAPQFAPPVAPMVAPATAFAPPQQPLAPAPVEPASAPAPAPVVPPAPASVPLSMPAPQAPAFPPLAPAPVAEIHQFQPPASFAPPAPAPAPAPLAPPAPVIPISAPAPVAAPEPATGPSQFSTILPPQPAPEAEAAPTVRIVPPTFEWQTPSSGTGA